MTENRLVDMILWGVMLTGGAILGVIYLMSPARDSAMPLAVPALQAEREGRKARAQWPRVPMIAETPRTAGPAAEVHKEGGTSPPRPSTKGAASSKALEGNESSVIFQKNFSPPPASSPVKEDVPPAGKSEGDAAGPENRRTSLPGAKGDTGAPRPVSSNPAKVTIHETAKPNGTLFSAQEVGEGTVVGKRGAADDSADFYKLRVTGKRLDLRLEPSVKDREGRFAMIVFDDSQKPIGEDFGKTGSPLSLEVKPQATYYIKVDLRNAPIEVVPYQLHIRFD